MILLPTQLRGLMVAETAIQLDPRGSFTRLFCDIDLSSAIADRHIVQINYSSTTRRGTIRGLHYQTPPFAETKLIRCLRGTVWDVAVDLRADSPTFLRWHAVELSRANGRMVIVAEGFAHGFQTLSSECELLYLHTAPYAQKAEAGVAWDDPRINVAWPLPLPDQDCLSARDRLLPQLPQNFAGLAE